MGKMLLVQSSWDKVIYNEEKKKTCKRYGRPDQLLSHILPPQAMCTESNIFQGTREKNHALLFRSPNSSLRLSLQRAQSRFFLGPP
jgi:hypothetical protein